MKHYVSKNLLRGLIFIFTASLFLAGCVQGGKNVPLVTEKFNSEYYIFKKAEDADFTRLQHFRLDDDPQLAAEASLMLGYYYMRQSDLENAAPLLMRYHNNTNMSPYMQNLGKIWMMELSIQLGNNEDTHYWAQTVALERDDDYMISAMQTYCATMRMFPDPVTGYYGCIETRLQNNAIVEIPDNETTQYQQNEELEILVTSSKDVSSAIFYYMQNHDMRAHKVRFEKAYMEGNWDYIIDIDNGYLGGPGYGLFFSVDLVTPLMDIGSYTGLSTCDNVIIGAGNNLMAVIGKLKDELVVEGLNVEVMNIADSGSVTPLRKILTDWEEKSFCAVAVGTEQEINNFVPNVKQYVRNATKQKIYILVDIDTGRHYSKQYLPYYAGSFLFPMVDISLSETSKLNSEDFYDNTGMQLTYEAMLAQDMMQFIYLQTEDYSNIDISSMYYLTNIVRFESGKAVRPLRAFFIHKTGEIEPLILSGTEAE